MVWRTNGQGDSADGYPGIAGPGRKERRETDQSTRPHRKFPGEILKPENRERALRFKELATRRTDAPLFKKVDELRWKGATPRFAAFAKKIGT